MEYKPDLDRVKKYWDAFWTRQIIDRPCVFVTAPKDETKQKERSSYMAGSDGKYEKALKVFDEWAASTYFGGEAIPYFNISFGPDQFSAFLGAELTMAEDKTTSWVKSYISHWKTVDIQLREDNSTWNRMLEYMRFATQFSEGKFLISMLDLHSNMDCLSALRCPQGLCMDIIDCPDEVERVLMQVRALYALVYEGIYKAGDMKHRGTIGWAPFYCAGKFATIQCDFICMISPGDARRFVIPSLSEEASFLDHSVFHLDGPQALVHLDDILAIPEIDVIQWVPGAGESPMIEWMDLLKKIQKAKKGLEIKCSKEEVKEFHQELDPEGILYRVEASSRREADDLILWLRNNT